MPTPEVTYAALAIFPDSLSPRIKAILERAAPDDLEDYLETLKDRQVLDLDQRVEQLNLNDPLIILNLLLNLQGFRALMFDGANDEFGLDRIKRVRRLRNDWAHFTPNSESAQLNAIHWLLEKSNDRKACRRFDASVSAPQRAQRSRRSAETAVEVQRRATQVATDERRIKKQERGLDQREQAVVEREAKLQRDADAIADQERLLKREREEIDSRRAAVEQREQAMQRAPAPDDLLRRERSVEAEEVMVAQLRREYETAQARLGERRQELEAQEIDARRRRQALEQRELEIEDRYGEANALSSRLTDALTRLEGLEQRLLKPPAPSVASPAPSPPAGANQTRGGAAQREPKTETDPERKRAQPPPKSSSQSRPCRRQGCRGRLVQKDGKFGAFYGCITYPDCRYSEDAGSGEEPSATSYGECPDCDGMLLRRNSYRGRFLGCINYPRCRYTEDLRESSGVVTE